LLGRWSDLILQIPEILTPRPEILIQWNRVEVDRTPLDVNVFWTRLLLGHTNWPTILRVDEIVDATPCLKHPPESRVEIRSCAEKERPHDPILAIVRLRSGEVERIVQKLPTLLAPVLCRFLDVRIGIVKRELARLAELARIRIIRTRDDGTPGACRALEEVRHRLDKRNAHI
jgi:hypothetical protein